jgi:hypothetical protein
MDTSSVLEKRLCFLELYFMQPKIKTDNNNKKKGNNLDHGLMGSLGFHASGQKHTISKTQGPIFVNFAT